MAKAQKLSVAYLTKDGETHARLSGDAEYTGILFTTENGTEAALGLEEVPASVAQYATLWGLAEKTRNSISGSKDWPAADVADAVLNQVEALKSGDWVRDGERAPARPIMLAKALVALKPEKYTDVAVALEEIGTWSKDRKKEISGSALVQSTMAKIKQEELGEAAAEDSIVDSL